MKNLDMSSPSEREIKDYIEEIANKNDQIGKLDKDIKDLCEKLVSLAKTLSPQYYAYFLSIYRCLLLHLKVHFGPNFADCRKTSRIQSAPEIGLFVKRGPERGAGRELL